MQYKIPQNVQRADTIIGPITFPQLAILLVGGGISYALYLMLSKIYYWYVYIWPVGFFAVLTLAIAFVKIADMTFLRYILYMYEFMTKPRQRIWNAADGQYFHSYAKKPLNDSVSGEKVETSFDQDETEKARKLKEITDILDQ